MTSYTRIGPQSSSGSYSRAADENLPYDTNPSKGSSKKAPKAAAAPEVASATSSGQIDDGNYRSPEYYGHNANSFYDYMIDMSKYRLKQPSNKS
ncbi:unnamed protein product [Medioppia subpectinata]|uniref:NADH dehydrogenase [ubiquinone] flavoprotein 3, mitochondrial n=1 Tax=Medioppia subpectinata TaxID=1979941 RepID=A0A7R9KDK9_9ACAR|nr:unnamed protein product [Medioppia subpectinata]CAG2101322.1 unnamed protein product [Medioppia subpectinata]